jgi:pyridoxamine 5'-phosphate oxidase
MEKKIAAIRKDYSHRKLIENEVSPNPVQQFEKWWQEATEAKIEEPNAMVLATASPDGVPSARVVLLKDYSEEGFVFFTNYHSFKGKQLSENPKACLVFFWKELERQVRITGLVEKISAKQSDEYYQSRPEASRKSAWASPQSQVIESREWIDEQFNKISKQMEGSNIQRPPYWGGFIVNPIIVEFWQGRPNRLHDRIQYTMEDDGKWKLERLAP